ncbi:MAG: hypothetical protein ABIR28_03440 [Vicinamibacteria bacterium]
MTDDIAPKRLDFVHTLAEEAAAGRKRLLLAPLGAGKTHTLLQVQAALEGANVPFVFVDLFMAASTPERFLAILAEAVLPFMAGDADAIQSFARECVDDRHNASSGLLRLFDLLATHRPSRPFVWLVDEVTEIRSLAYFPDLGQIETSFIKALTAGRGAVLASSYLGLAVDLFPDVEAVSLPGLSPADFSDDLSFRADGPGAGLAIVLTRGHAATLRLLMSDLQESRDLGRSLTRLLSPGAMLELLCRRHYEILLMRSRGYAVCKRAAEVVATNRGQRLTDLFPLIGRTAGASRQYLRWLVEVGLLTQVRKRYDFADPVLGLWASVYLGRALHPTDAALEAAVRSALDGIRSPSGTTPHAVAEAASLPRRVDRFEEFD